MNLKRAPNEDDIDITSQGKLLKTEFNIVTSKKIYDAHMGYPCDPLQGEQIDKLLEDPDESNFLARITEVFWSLDALSQSFYPVVRSQESKSSCTAEVDFRRLELIYERLASISESEEGVFEKIISESIQNVQSQQSDFVEFQYKSGLLSCLRVMLIWLSFKKLYDPQYESVTTSVADYFYELEEMDFYNREISEKFFSDWDYEEFLTIIKINQQQLTFLMFDQPEEDSDELEKVRRYFLIIDLFFSANKHRKQLKISSKEFHIDLLNKEWVENLPDYYFDWYKARRGVFADFMEISEDDNAEEIDKRCDHFLYNYIKLIKKI